MDPSEITIEITKVGIPAFTRDLFNRPTILFQQLEGPVHSFVPQMRGKRSSNFATEQTEQIRLGQSHHAARLRQTKSRQRLMLLDQLQRHSNSWVHAPAVLRTLLQGNCYSPARSDDLKSGKAARKA